MFLKNKMQHKTEYFSTQSVHETSLLSLSKGRGGGGGSA